MLALAAGVLAGLRAVGSLRAWADVVYVLFGLAAGISLARWVARRVARHSCAESRGEPRLWRKRAPATAGILAGALASWGALSGGDHLLDAVGGPRTRIERHADANRCASPRTPPPAPLGLTLSGGGYRAALFHAGVLSTLDSLGLCPTALATVSGGSIAGAYYALGGNPRTLATAVAQGRFQLVREVLHIEQLPRLLFTARSIRDVQADVLARVLFGDAPMRARRADFRPPVLLAASDLLHGRLIGVTAEGAVEAPLPLPATRLPYVNQPWTAVRHLHRFRPVAAGGLPRAYTLAELVATSGAFPGPFAPLVVRETGARVTAGGRTTVGASGGPAGEAEPLAWLSDGGLSDNTGAAAFAHARRWARIAADTADCLVAHMYTAERVLAPWDVPRLIVSDASALPSMARASGLRRSLNAAVEFLYAATRPELPRVPAKGVGTDGEDLPLFLLSPALLTYELTADEVKQQRWLGRSAWMDEPLRDMAKALNGGRTRSGADTAIRRQLREWSREVGRRSGPLGAMWDNLSAPEVVAVIARRLPLSLQECIADWRAGHQARHAECRAVRRARGDDDGAIRALLQLEVNRSLVAFASLPTLSDHPDADQAWAVFRLGQYVTLMNAAEPPAGGRAVREGVALARNGCGDRCRPRTFTVGGPPSPPSARRTREPGARRGDSLTGSFAPAHWPLLLHRSAQHAAGFRRVGARPVRARDAAVCARTL